jgi:hypothetical protein
VRSEEELAEGGLEGGSEGVAAGCVFHY